MKNIHVLPTEKPSRLYKIENKLGLLEEPNRNFLAKNQHIYITTDEEIKEGDYFLYDGTKIRYKSNGTEYHGRDLCHISGNHRYPVSESKKIILTTDQDLNGVQAIDDEFLEWFVKNPSCESVDVEIKPMFPMYSTFIESIDNPPFYGNLKRKIIIPQEEPKQETLEEAARRYTESTPDNDPVRIFSFIEGAKWQAERRYSEEEVLKLLITFSDDRTFLKKDVAIKWFEQFKNKGGDK